MFKNRINWWFYLIFLILFIASIWLPKALTHQPNGVYLLIVLLAFIITGPPVLAHDIKRIHPFVWLVAGLLLLLLLFVPTYLLVEYFPYDLPAWFKPIAQAALLLAPSLAIIVAALLIYTGITQLGKHVSDPPGLDGTFPSADFSRARLSRWIALSALVLAAALVGRLFYNFFWLIVWDSTYDAIEILWLFLPVYSALFSMVVLVIALPGWGKLAGVYGLVMPALLIGITLLAKRVDYRQLTETRAEQVSQAIEAFYARQGYYPQTLRQLVPRYLLSLPAPLIINGQTWCYDSSGSQASGSAAFYRLGYMDRSHWSDPGRSGHLYKTMGVIPDLPPVCAAEISQLGFTQP